ATATHRLGHDPDGLVASGGHQPLDEVGHRAGITAVAAEAADAHAAGTAADPGNGYGGGDGQAAVAATTTHALGHDSCGSITRSDHGGVHRVADAAGAPAAAGEAAHAHAAGAAADAGAGQAAGDGHAAVAPAAADGLGDDGRCVVTRRHHGAHGVGGDRPGVAAIAAEAAHAHAAGTATDAGDGHRGQGAHPAVATPAADGLRQQTHGIVS